MNFNINTKNEIHNDNITRKQYCLYEAGLTVKLNSTVHMWGSKRWESHTELGELNIMSLGCASCKKPAILE